MAKTELNDKKGVCSDWNKAIEIGNKNALEYISRFVMEKLNLITRTPKVKVTIATVMAL